MRLYSLLLWSLIIFGELLFRESWDFTVDFYYLYPAASFDFSFRIEFVYFFWEGRVLVFDEVRTETALPVLWAPMERRELKIYCYLLLK